MLGMLIQTVLSFLVFQSCFVNALRLPRQLPSSNVTWDRNLSLNSPFSPQYQARDVFSPAITSPAEDTIWFIGENVTVTWDTRDAPAQITNRIGEIVLRRFNDTEDHKYLGMKHPLVRGYDIMRGSVTITVPNVEPGGDYFIILFGDSGNNSPFFTIQYQDDVNSTSLRPFETDLSLLTFPLASVRRGYPSLYTELS